MNRAGYNAKKGGMHTEVNKGAPPPRQMTKKIVNPTWRFSISTDVWPQEEDTELFDERADEVVLIELK